MAEKIRIAINGYGNLGKAVELAASKAEDLDPVVVFTRRDPATVRTAGTPVASVADMEKWSEKVDICVNCGGSATDMEQVGPRAVQFFSTVDSFDTHAKIPQYFAAVDAAAKKSGHLAMISSGWDPGLFSLNRLLAEAILPQGKTWTFWGPGISQGHGDAIRRVEGVAAGVQYTIPVSEAVEAAQNGSREDLSARQMHRRVCYVVAEEGADLKKIEHDIVNMPNYFADYDTTVTFISREELERKHSGMPHGGQVIRSGNTSEGIDQVYTFGLKLDSNPEFTGSVLVASARAVHTLAAKGQTGAITIFDVPPAYLSAKTGQQLRSQLL